MAMGTLPLALRHSSSSGKRGGFFRSSRPGCPGQDAASSVCCLVIVSFTASQRLQAIAIRRLWLEMPRARMAPHEPHTRSGAEPLVPRIMIVSFLAGRKTARFFRISFRFRVDSRGLTGENFGESLDKGLSKTILPHNPPPVSLCSRCCVKRIETELEAQRLHYLEVSAPKGSEDGFVMPHGLLMRLPRRLELPYKALLVNLASAFPGWERNVKLRETTLCSIQ